MRSVGVLAVLGACSSGLPEPFPVDLPRALEEPAVELRAAHGELAPSKEVLTACDLPDTRSEAPHFDFDDSTLRPEGRFILDGVMICMLRGALVGASITLVGHTDPRGAEAYNHALGIRRASAARDFLVLRGVMPSRITVRSRGEMDARGTGPESWQLDRRVEIHQANAVTPP